MFTFLVFSPLLSCYRLVLRIRADDPNAVCQLGIKFGCSLSDGRELLNTAKDLGLNVVGIRYHTCKAVFVISHYTFSVWQ